MTNWRGRKQFENFFMIDDLAPHDSRNLELIFNRCFEDGYQTRLIGGASEPEYLPVDGQFSTHRLLYRADFFASALHEIAHWCIAGAERRTKRDFGYWYETEQRSEAAQRAFERVEVKPQALECLFSEACGFEFRISVDNPGLDNRPSSEFVESISQQIRIFLAKGLPERAETFLEALHQAYKQYPVSQAFSDHMNAVVKNLTSQNMEILKACS